MYRGRQYDKQSRAALREIDGRGILGSSMHGLKPNEFKGYKRLNLTVRIQLLYRFKFNGRNALHLTHITI